MKRDQTSRERQLREKDFADLMLLNFSIELEK